MTNKLNLLGVQLDAQKSQQYRKEVIQFNENLLTNFRINNSKLFVRFNSTDRCFNDLIGSIIKPHTAKRILISLNK